MGKTSWDVAQEDTSPGLVQKNWQAAVFPERSDRRISNNFSWYEPGTSQLLPHAISEITGMTLMRDVSSRSRHIPLDGVEESVLQTGQRALNRANWFREFLEADDLRVAPTIIHETRDGGDTHYNFAYTSMWFGHREEFVAFRRARSILTSAQQYPTVTVLSGHCLFSSLSLSWRTPDGIVPGIDILQDEGRRGAIVDFLVDPRPSLYELEASRRLATVVAAIADRIHHTRLLIKLSYPRAQYYFPLFSRYQRGELDERLLRLWVEAVDQRYTEAAERILEQLHVWCHRVRPGDLMVQVSDGLVDIDPAIRDCIWLGRAFDPKTAFVRLCERDETWALLAMVAMPRTWTELIHLSYAAEHLRAALWRHGQKPRLLLTVEDPAERLTFGAAERLAKLIRRHKPEMRYDAFGVYPLERTLIGGMGRRVRAHRFDPGHDVIGPNGQAMQIERLLSLLFQGSA